MKLTNDLVVLDLETTGTWVDKDKIVEIAMIKLTPSGEKTTYDRRLNPGMPIPPAVTKLIGITNADVADAPAFRDVAVEILDFIGQADLAGFNVEKFDLPLLERELREAGHRFDWRLRKIYDAQKVFHLNEKRDLTAAYRFYCQKPLENAHSAMVDTEATLEILQAQIERYGEGSGELRALDQFEYVNHAEFYDDERRFRWWNGKLYMMFGKYAKKYSLQEVVRRDPKYLEWILSANFSDEVKTLVRNALNQQYPIPPQGHKDPA